MKGASTVVKLSLVVLSVTLGIMQMKLDALCEPSCEGGKTETGLLGGMIKNNLSLSNIKTSGIAAMVALTLSYFISKSAVNAEVATASPTKIDVHEAAVKLETENYFQKQIKSQSNGHAFNDGQMNENFVDDYVPPSVENNEEWQREDNDSADSDYEYDMDDEIHDRVERDTKIRNFEEKRIQCRKYEDQVVERFADKIIDSVDNNNSTLILKEGQRKKMDNKLRLIKRKCSREPVEYVGQVKVNGKKTGEYEYTINETDRLRKMADKYRKPATISPPNNINNEIVSDDNSTLILNGTDFNVSTNVNNLTVPTTERAPETTENAQCEEKEFALLARWSNGFYVKLVYDEPPVFDYNQDEHEGLSQMLQEMRDMNCERIPLKYVRPVFNSKAIKFHHEYTLGDNISRRSILKRLYYDVEPTTIIPTDTPECAEKKHQMTQIVRKELRQALKDGTDTFEVKSLFNRNRMNAINEELINLNCTAPFEYEPEENSNRKFTMNITDETFVQKWEDDRKAKRKAERQNARNSTILISDEIPEENFEETDIEIPEHPKCDNKRNRLLKKVEVEVDRALRKNQKSIRVAQYKEMPIKRLIKKMEEDNCAVPLKMEERELGIYRRLDKYKILDFNYVREFAEDDESEEEIATTSAKSTQFTTLKPTTASHTQSTDDGITYEPCDAAGISLVKEFKEEIKQAINANTNKIIVSIDDHGEAIPRLNQYARHDCANPLINFDAATGSGEEENFAYYKFTNEARIREILKMPPMTTTTRPTTTVTTTTTTRRPKPRPTQDPCLQRKIAVLGTFISQVKYAQLKGQNFIDLHPAEDRQMKAELNKLDGCSNLPFTNRREQKLLLITRAVRYDFSPNIRSEYPGFFRDAAYRPDDMVLQLPPISSSQQDFTGVNDSTSTSPKGIKLAQIALDNDITPQSTTAQSITPEQTTTMKPICEEILNDTVNEFEGAFKKMFEKGGNQLKLSSKQGNKLIERERTLTDNACPSSFHMTEMKLKGNDLRFFFDVEMNKFIRDAENRILQTDK